MKLIKLTQGKVSKVDDEDFEKLNNQSWCAHKERKTFYAYGWIDKKVNGLNNQKSNLRISDNSQNGKNKRPGGISKYLGVHKSDLKHIKKNGELVIYYGWKSEIRIKGKNTHIGRFRTEKEAAKAYDNMALVHHGEFANLNFK